MILQQIHRKNTLMEDKIMENKKEMSAVLADFCELLKERNVPFETNENDPNMIRFRTKLPNHDSTPLVFIHYNTSNRALSLALSQMVRFDDPSIEVYKAVNEFNSDAESFGCKAFLDINSEFIVLVNAIISGEDGRSQIEDYLNISILAINKHYGKIIEKIDNNENN